MLVEHLDEVLGALAILKFARSFLQGWLPIFGDSRDPFSAQLLCQAKLKAEEAGKK